MIYDLTTFLVTSRSSILLISLLWIGNNISRFSRVYWILMICVEHGATVALILDIIGPKIMTLTILYRMTLHYFVII